MGQSRIAHRQLHYSLLVLFFQNVQYLVLLERQFVLRVLGFVVVERLGDRDIRHVGLVLFEIVFLWSVGVSRKAWIREW